MKAQRINPRGANRTQVGTNQGMFAGTSPDNAKHGRKGVAKRTHRGGKLRP